MNESELTITDYLALLDFTKNLGVKMLKETASVDDKIELALFLKDLDESRAFPLDLLKRVKESR